MTDAVVVSVSRDGAHRFSKPPVDEIMLLAGLGVEGDAHLGVTVQHLSRVRVDPTRPNLRQVHLIQAELHDEVREQGFDVEPGQMGENFRKAGIMGVVRDSGPIRAGDPIVVELPERPHLPLERV
ncbi:MAG TPA: hypothetical protein VGJ28_14675 [Micromonosporaceae bacterium]